MKSIINWVWRVYFQNRNFEYTKDEMLSFQDEFLIDNIISNRNTVVGRVYDFDSISSYNDYKKIVPVFHYDDYKEYIYMSVKWQKNVICDDDIDFWAKTSGTTSDYHKYIPVTKRYLENNHYKWWKDTFSNYVNCNPETKLFEWKWLVLGGAMSKNEFTGEDNVWYISAILQTNNNPLIRMFFTEPDQDISFLTNWSDKISKIIETCKDKNIVSTIWVTSRSIYLMKRIIEVLGVNYIDDIWPDYELFLTGGMDYRPLESSICKLFNKKINIRQAYNTSEWYFAVQTLNNSPYMKLLCCHDVYYEFLAQEDYDMWRYENAINLHSIQKWINYVLIITNSAGLYRYIIGDTINFVDVDDCLFEIVWRTKDYLNAFSEQLRENHTSQAIYNISNKYKIDIVDYHVWSIMSQIGDGSWYHHWLIELWDSFDVSVWDDSDIYINNDNIWISLFEIEDLLDDELKKINSFYDGKRSGNLLLHRPKVKILPKWTFHKRLEAKWKLWWQNKTPKLRNNDIIIKEIIKFT